MRKRLAWPKVLLGLFALAFPSAAFSFPNETWYHLRSEHFNVSYTDDTRLIAQKAVTIAEQTRSDLRSYLGDLINEESISIVLSNANDYSNGSAAQLVPLVHIDCRKIPFLFRGETQWLKTVLTHELSHIYSFQILRSGFVVSTYAGLFGQTQGSVSAAFGILDLPVWFLEGIAQMGSHRKGADDHDVFRRMLLRDSVRSNRFLTLSEMARFEGSGLDYERAYNQGFSFLLYLEETYTQVSFSQLVPAIRSQGFENAFFKIYGKSLSDLYDEWKSFCQAQFSKDADFTSLKPVVERKDRAPLEVASASDGEFVIANWGNDYERYRLFRRTGPSNYESLDSDVGEVLKQDRATKDIWYSKLDYQWGAGVDRYDIYKRSPSGEVRKMTSNSRSIAFDAYNGTLIYARYREMKTQIVRKTPDGVEKTLYEFGDSSVVSSLSCIDDSSFLLTYGDGGGYRLAVYQNGELKKVAPTLEVVEASYAGERRAVVTTVVDGRLQVGWIEFDQISAVYPLTEVPVAARFASWSEQSPNQVLVCEFQDGGFKLARVETNWSKDRALSLPPENPENGEAAPTQVFRGVNQQYNFVFGPPVVLFEIDSVLGTSGGNLTSSWYSSLGYSQEFYSAPEDFSLGGTYILNAPLSSNALNFTTYQFEGHTNFNLGMFRNSMQFQANSSIQTSGSTQYHFFDTLFSAVSQVQISDGQYLGALIENYNDTYTDKNLFQFGLTTFGLRWSWSDVPYSVFDPADLGPSRVFASLGADFQWPGLNPLLIYQSWVNTSGKMVEKFQGQLGGNALLWDSKLNLGLSVDAYTYLSAVEGSAVTLGTLDSIGGSRSFSGYSSDYASINDLARASASIEFSPFADKYRKVQFLDRWSLFAKSEAAGVRYYKSGLNFATPVSVEAGIKGQIYFSSSTPTTLRLRWATALNDFLGTLTSPYRIYFDVTF